MTTTIFITGTDTDAGKTVITSACLYGLGQQGYQTLGFKPVAAGATKEQGDLVNSDAKALAKYSSCKVTPLEINPVCFKPPIAPHIAAQRDGVEINSDQILSSLIILQNQYLPDVTLVEGAGGWRVPLNLTGQTLADLPKEQHWPVILVVGIKLGCLNHALLTANAIISDGLPLIGWVANCIDVEMSEANANIETLQTLLEAPCLGVVPHLSEAAPEQVWLSIEQGIKSLAEHHIAKACSKE